MADSRFDALSTDPRYRLPNRKEGRTAVDPRFKRIFKDRDFRQKATVDRYGRKVDPKSGKQKLERLYRVEKDDGKSKSKQRFGREVVGSSEEDSEDDEDSEAEAAVKKRDPAREGGFSESESESEEESASDEESEDEAELAEETAGQEQTESIPMGEVSRRIAAVNLDWDNLRASDIMAVASSFVPVDGRIESVRVYPSEFGQERMQREELEGPPREIFASSKRHAEDDESGSDEEDDEEGDTKIERQLQQDQVNEGDEFDTAKLRQYQLERLRYHYAVLTCSNKTTAKAIYDSMDGREYLTSANFFDLRFIPDETSFDDDKPRDECTKLPDGYRPNDFRTEALTHSNVRLTWDDDDPTRKEVQKRAFSRAEMDENDLQAYIGSDSSDAESTASRKSTAEDRKAKKREAERAKMRAALGLAAESHKADGATKKKGDEVVGDMQITFTSGLGGSGAGEKSVFENEPQDEESTRDRYIRKERERKQKRKEKMKASRPAEAAEEDDQEEDAAIDDQGFDDPFFTDPTAAAAAEKKAKKDARKQKLAAQAAQDEEAASRRAELELLMVEDQGDSTKHFDMREIEKAEKEARRKGKKKDKKSKKRIVEQNEDGFTMETEDPRFKALFESHEYAIDPTNPKFKKTEGMSKLLEEGRKKRKLREVDEDDEVGEPRDKKKTAKGAGGKGELEGLVKRLKGGSKSKK
ncbi:pre-rRNA-processing protein esf1 [Saxophila tyrrhenica]|uniref:Pre-rRNA-processing protein esf1 n=1 Tax=Saxophila tyrrhenica TaxID=1690608 RepID=A0AAV9NZT0_9PEZI|nr:pre-rRNA-processing protein esf1 [Saxophila tyrrhenica]